MKEAKALIEGSGYRMIMTDNLDDAAAKAVKIADIVRQVRSPRLLNLSSSCYVIDSDYAFLCCCRQTKLVLVSRLSCRCDVDGVKLHRPAAPHKNEPRCSSACVVHASTQAYNYFAAGAPPAAAVVKSACPCS